MKTPIIEYRTVPPLKEYTEREKKMMDKAQGMIIFTNGPGLSGDQEEERKAPVQTESSIYFFSKEAAKYIGCSLRHLYYLTENRGLPYFAVGSPGMSLRYYFRKIQVDEWLASYRGKGVTLGKKQSGLSDELKPGLKTVITGQKDRHSKNNKRKRSHVKNKGRPDT